MVKLEFVHIPKTGGTSIEHTYNEYKFGKFSINCIGTENKDCNSFWHNCQPINRMYNNSKTFCVIRNPIDKLISEIKYRDRKRNKINNKYYFVIQLIFYLTII